MEHGSITAAALEAFEAALLREEKGRSTHEYYLTASINTIIAALNSFFRCVEREDCRLKSLRCQRRSFDAEDKDEQHPEQRPAAAQQDEQDKRPRTARQPGKRTAADA